MIKYTVTPEMKLKAVRWYEPRTNKYHSVLLDETTGLLIGLEKRIYRPAGGMKACNQIADSGLVLGSVVYGFECRHAHDLVYMLESNKNEH